MATATKPATPKYTPQITLVSTTSYRHDYRVESQREQGRFYEVMAVPYTTWENGQTVEKLLLRCTCQARKSCWHKAAVELLLQAEALDHPCKECGSACDGELGLCQDCLDEIADAAVEALDRAIAFKQEEAWDMYVQDAANEWYW